MNVVPVSRAASPGPQASRPIRVLPDEVASKIAAGEVIERPASVVRELLDNAIDAGASQISVEIRGGGRELIRVIDNGSGVSKQDLPRAFLRHATSKIRTADDLWAVKTLGFRGEALFSIAAVGKVALVSRPPNAQMGYEMVVEGGAPLSEGPRGAPYGTVVTVRELFYNLPARLKFLKSQQTEAAYIATLVQQYALARPTIRFTLSNEGRLTFRSSGNGDLRTAASFVYGDEMARALLPVGVEPDEVSEQDEEELSLPEGGMQVFGYVSPPAHSRSNRQAMHFFINRRAVQSRMLQFAVEEAYHSLLMIGRHPICIINVMIDPSALDVNVHPAKAEVKFRDERAVFSAVQRAVRSALTAHVPPPLYGSRGAEGWSLPQSQPDDLEVEFRQPLAPSGPLQSDLWRSEGSYPGTSTPDVEPLPPAPARGLPPMRVVGQISNTYIIAEGPDGLYLVDQHAAHERVLYERIGAALEKGDPAVQPLLQPIALELPPRQRAEIEPALPLMSELGFELEPFGEGALLLRAVPAIYAGSKRDLGEDVLEVLDTVTRGSPPERWREELAITLACHSAARAGQTLSLDEMRSLMGQLELCQYPRACAHGRPTMLHLSQLQLEREFGRRA